MRHAILGHAEEIALQIFDPPRGEERCGFLILHPFRDRLDLEMTGKLQQRLHEKPVIRRAGKIFHEGAIDLQNIDGQ